MGNSRISFKRCLTLGYPRSFCILIGRCQILFSEDSPDTARRIIIPVHSEAHTKKGLPRERIANLNKTSETGERNIRLRAGNNSKADEEKPAQTHLELHPSISIQGGHQAANRLRRYMAYVGGSCSGVVIGRRWVMTSAHCKVASGTKVWFGIPRTGSRGVHVKVRRTFNHPKYPDGRTAHFDIALLELERSAPKGTLFMRVNKKNNFPQSGAPVRAVGYGYFSKTQGDGILRQVDLRVMDSSICARKTKLVLKHTESKKYTICAVSPGGLCGTW